MTQRGHLGWETPFVNLLKLGETSAQNGGGNTEPSPKTREGVETWRVAPASILAGEGKVQTTNDTDR